MYGILFQYTQSFQQLSAEREQLGQQYQQHMAHMQQQIQQVATQVGSMQTILGQTKLIVCLSQCCTDKYLFTSIWLLNENIWSPGFLITF